MDVLALDAQSSLVAPLFGGVFQGAAYGLLGLGLVLVYKSNRIFNFAQGEFATVGGLVAFWFASGATVFGLNLPNVPYLVALILGVLASVGVALATERVVIRPMFDRPRVVLVVGTVGVALLLIALEGLAYPATANLESISDVLGISPRLGTVDGVAILYEDIIKLIALAVLAVGSFLFFRYTATGTAILAVSQDATAARVVGISVERISMITWGFAGLLGGVAGVVLSLPGSSLFPGVFTGTALTTAFAAAVLGGMTSLPGAFVGGLGMGLIEAFANADVKYIPGLDTLHGSGEVTVAVFLLLVLLVRPRGLLGKAA
ncbi:MAG: branched-chain amino acid transport system permease protein [Frankiales bacterium]|jgi:branched-chain amino acid transport system permease protein|nr:branched-chain amino acid transport system permease protein [Frankiales bacterium]